MEVTFERCCGLDIHKQSVVACLIVPGHKEIRTFGTMTADLLQQADWLTEQRVTHVAMESTSVYWNRHEGFALTAQHESLGLLPSTVQGCGLRPRLGLVP